MSVPVSIAELGVAIDQQLGWCYLLTVSDAGIARVLAVTPRWTPDASALVIQVGQGTAKNVTARPAISLVWPPVLADAMSLIVDGIATVNDQTVTFSPTSAVMHRSAVQ